MTTERWNWLRIAAKSQFGRNAAWFAALSVAERLLALVQTVVIARVLGVTEYGIYGFLIATIGFIASVLGLQMGLTATVFVSRYRAADNAKAAAVISIASKFSWLVGFVPLAAAVPFSHELSRSLLGSEGYVILIILGTVFLGATIVGGVQDGIAQGLELFVPLARIKIFVALATLIAVFAIATQFGLEGVLVAVLGGVILKYLAVQRMLSLARRVANIPTKGSSVSLGALLAGFSIPSMAVSLGVGFATWFGMFLLSHSLSGFDEVAVANTGLQWRGPALLLASALGSVAIPAFSRLTSADDIDAARTLQSRLLLASALMATAVGAGLVLASGPILRLYGDQFDQGLLAFCGIVLSTIPTVMANVYQQALVGAARMWRQLWAHVPFVIVLVGGFALLIPDYRALGYAAALFIGSTVHLATLWVADLADRRPHMFPVRRA